MNDLELLKKVIDFKANFYPQGWANYKGAAEGKIKLVPESYMQKKLESDYEQMKEMIFGAPPSFDEIMKTISEFEQRLNEAFV
ncbi:hypothetical protein MNBD_GAMMA07-628 [hydrothermal vent metagenome]|uniref:Uncharacterized protein n=1 Tax=hydrothermal vent metagenome TaxID=652676 RepID=A0A3B0X1R1_9ZZZZ